MSSEIHHHAGRIASLSRYRDPDDPELVDARRSLCEASIARYIRETLAKFPPLTAAQRDRLAELLRPVRRGGAK